MRHPWPDAPSRSLFHAHCPPKGVPWGQLPLVVLGRWLRLPHDPRLYCHPDALPKDEMVPGMQLYQEFR